MSIERPHLGDSGGYHQPDGEWMCWHLDPRGPGDSLRITRPTPGDHDEPRLARFNATANKHQRHDYNRCVNTIEMERFRDFLGVTAGCTPTTSCAMLMTPALLEGNGSSDISVQIEMARRHPRASAHGVGRKGARGKRSCIRRPHSKARASNRFLIVCLKAMSPNRHIA